MPLFVVDASTGAVREYSNSELPRVINRLNANNIRWEFADSDSDSDSDDEFNFQKVIDDTKCQIKALQEVYKKILNFTPNDIGDYDSYTMDDLFDAVEYLALLKKTYGEIIEMYKNSMEILLCAKYKRKCNNTDKLKKRLSELDENMRDLLLPNKFDVFDESMYLDYCDDFKLIYQLTDLLTRNGMV